MIAIIILIIIKPTPKYRLRKTIIYMNCAEEVDWISAVNVQ